MQYSCYNKLNNQSLYIVITCDLRFGKWLKHLRVYRILFEKNGQFGISKSKFIEMPKSCKQ